MMLAREPARTFRDLIVWQKAHGLVKSIYEYTAGFPKQEMYGLVSQMRRAAVSIPSNIAEGFRRQSRPDKIRFMNIAQGSVEEVRYYLILAAELKFGANSQLNNTLEEVSRLLDAYWKGMRKTQASPSPDS